jgi:phage terminase large subunit-like protein
MLQEDPDVDTDKEALLYLDDKGEITWQNKKYSCVLPEQFTPEGIGKEGVSGLMKDVDIFNLQYMLNPMSPRKVKFTTQMIHYWTDLPRGLNYYLIVDPADSEEKRACYTAMKVMGIDSDDNWYWVDGVFDKIDDLERIEEAVRLAQKWSVFEVLWENLSFGRTDNKNLERRRREIPGANWQVRPIGASRVSKDDRILGLNDRYSRGKVFWAKKMYYYSKFEGKTIDIVKSQEYEFLGFPLVSHKDLLDAESFLLQIDLIKGDKQTIEPSKFSHIKDPIQRGNTEVFWHDFNTWKENGFRTPESMAMSEEDNY